MRPLSKLLPRGGSAVYVHKVLMRWLAGAGMMAAALFLIACTTAGEEGGAAKVEPKSTAKAASKATDTPAQSEPTAEAAPGDPVNQIAIAGVGGTVFAAIFAPSDVTVPVGSTLTWSNLGDWPHQVVFLGGSGTLPPLAQGQTERTRPANVQEGQTVSYDGTAFLHSGLLGRGQRISVTFPREGSFKYLCPIHPRMEGTVKVVPKGQPYTTARQAAESAKASRDAVVSLVEPQRDVFKNLYGTSVQRQDRSTLWSVPVGPRIGTPTGFLEVSEFIPQELTIKAGDSVRWYFFSPHTVTFLPPGQTTLPDAQPAPSPNAADYDGRSLINSGTLSFTAADGLRSFEMRFPRPGRYEYVCFLHYRLEGQKGTIIVE